MGVFSLLKEPQQKALVVLWTLGWGGAWRKARSGEVLGGENRENVLKVSPTPRIRRPQQSRSLPKVSDKET